MPYREGKAGYTQKGVYERVKMPTQKNVKPRNSANPGSRLKSDRKGK